MKEWPKDNRDCLEFFYGKHELNDSGNPSALWEHVNLERVTLPYTMKAAWKPEIPVRYFSVNIQCRKSIVEIFYKIHREFTASEISSLGLDLFGGCYCYRKRVNGSALSVHAWAAAIDIDPIGNPYGKKGRMPEKVIEIFEDEGWEWGGNWKVPDPMHFQAARSK